MLPLCHNFHAYSTSIFLTLIVKDDKRKAVALLEKVSKTLACF